MDEDPKLPSKSDDQVKDDKEDSINGVNTVSKENNTNNVNTASSSIKAASKDDNVVDGNNGNEFPWDLEIPKLEGIGIGDYSRRRCSSRG